MNIKKSVGIIKASAVMGAVLSIMSAATAFAGTPSVINAKITGPNTVTVVFSEAVITNDSAFGLFTGILEGRSVESVGNNGSTTIFLGLSGTPMPVGSSGYMQLTSATLSVSDQSSLAQITVNVADGQTQSSSSSNTTNNSTTPDTTSSPAYYRLTSEATRSHMRVGDSITFTLRPDAAFPKTGATVTGSYNGVTLNWQSTEGGAAYVAKYTVAAGDTNTTTVLQLTGVILTDADGKKSQPLSTTDVSSVIDTSTVTISETTKITSPADPLNLNYGFTSSKAGTINFGGACVSLMTGAISGVNTIKFKELPDGKYDNCVMTVSDFNGNTSNLLKVSPFAIGATYAASLLASLTPAPTPAATPAPVSSSYSFTATMAIGSSGSQVSELQAFLKKLGFLSGEPTGYYGSLTASAVSKFQASKGLASVGRVGPATLAALNGTSVPTTNSVTTPATPASGKYQFTRYLSLGATGDDVTELQKRLAAEGLYFGATTGTFSPLTQAGVMIFQAKNGIDPLGSVGPATRALLNK